MIISAVIGHGKNFEIGVGGKLPWRLSDDLKNFKKVTMGKPIAMGRKTFDSIGRALPGRENIVLTRDRGWKADNVTVLGSIEELVAYAREQDYEELVIIGGQVILEQIFDKLDKLYLTEVDGEFPEADAFFPNYDSANWQLVDSFSHPKDEKNEFSWTFKELVRK